MQQLELIAHNFTQAHQSYLANAKIQKQMATQLKGLLAKQQVYLKNCFRQNKFLNIADLGSGTHANLAYMLLPVLASLKITQVNLTLVDLVQAQDLSKLKTFAQSLEINLSIISENINVNHWVKQKQENKFHLVISNAMLQWLDDLDTFISNLKQNKLTASGLLIFSSLLSKNFKQLTKVSKQSLNYLTPKQLHKIINQNNLDLRYFRQYQQCLRFKELKQLLKHLKLTGVNNLNGHNQFWTRRKLTNFAEQYLLSNQPTSKYNSQNTKLFKLTYNPVLVCCYASKPLCY